MISQKKNGNDEHEEEKINEIEKKKELEENKKKNEIEKKKELEENEEIEDDDAEIDEEDENIIVNWPVYGHNLLGEIENYLLFFHNKTEIIVIDPISEWVILRKNIIDVSKISFDKNCVDEKNRINENQFGLFRIVFENREVYIFLSKDSNEIINCLISNLRLQKYLIIIEQNRLIEQKKEDGMKETDGNKNQKVNSSEIILNRKKNLNAYSPKIEQNFLKNINKDQNQIQNNFETQTHIKISNFRDKNFDKNFSMFETTPNFKKNPINEDQFKKNNGFAQKNFISKNSNQFGFNQTNIKIPNSEKNFLMNSNQNLKFSNFTINLKEKNFENQEDISLRDLKPNFYKTNLKSGLFEYNIFGIDKKQKFYPHKIGLYCYFIRHKDEKRTFSEHLYSDINEIEIDEINSKIKLNYENDIPYSFIVSEIDFKEIILLLKGRNFLYKFVKKENEKGKNEMEIFKIEDETETEKSETLFEKIVEETDIREFPKKFSKIEVKNIAFLDEKEQNKKIDEIEKKKEILKNLTNLEENISEIKQKEEFDQNYYDPFISLIQIKSGTNLYHYFFKKKKMVCEEKFFRVEENKTIFFGKNEKKLNEKRNFEILVVGENVKTVSKEISDNYKENSFVLRKNFSNDYLYLVAKDEQTFKYWINGLKSILNENK